MTQPARAIPVDSLENKYSMGPKEEELQWSLTLEPRHRTPARGSSSGSAVAVGEGILCASLGSDTAGSCRIPAAFNGTAGQPALSAQYRNRELLQWLRDQPALSP